MPPNARRLGGRKPLFALFRAVEVDLLDGARHGVVQRGLSLTVGLEACEHGIAHGPVEDDGVCTLSTNAAQASRSSLLKPSHA